MSGDFTQITRNAHLPARIAAQFNEQIQKGLLKPGDKLPTEHAMSKSFGVSRTVVREAIAQLRNEGMIETRQGVGAFVIERAARHIRLDDLNDMNAHAFRDLFQLRIPLEIEAAGLAASHHTPDHLRQMDAAMQRMGATAADEHDAILADLEFHRIIASATGNDYFVQFIGAISDRIIHTILHSRTRLGPDQIVSVVSGEHDTLRAAIASRDPMRARAAMRAHMAGSAERVALDLQFYA